MAFANLTGPKTSPLPAVIGPTGQRLFTGTSGMSPFNMGTASGIMPDFAKAGWVGGILANAWQSKHGSFQAPTFDRTSMSPLSLLARRRMFGQSGVGSTFLTGSGGVRPGNQTLGFSTLLGS